MATARSGAFSTAPQAGSSPRRITSFTVAAAAGVSQSTVARALRGDPSLDAETIERVLSAAAALEYVAAEPAKPAPVLGTKRIALVVDLENPQWSLLVPPLHDELSAKGYDLTLITADAETEEVQRKLLGGGIDGVILATVLLDSPLPLILQRLKIPTVLLQRYTDGDELDSSIANDFAGGELAAGLLLDAGHTHIAALFGPVDCSTGRDRAEGFRQRLADAGVPLDERFAHVGAADYDHGFNSVDALLARKPAPTALFCADDSIAFGVLNRAYELGLNIPQDLTVIGFDDLDQASWPTIGLTTISVPFDDLLHSAVALLLDRISGWAGGTRRVVHGVIPVLRDTHAQLHAAASPPSFVAAMTAARTASASASPFGVDGGRRPAAPIHHRPLRTGTRIS
ncbi:MAG: substrate-binding domain-containing protein [Microbacteriaceae bacterium]|nr:substrate-binding domain-containing protein [Microbacteriaceae bacterium]